MRPVAPLFLLLYAVTTAATACRADAVIVITSTGWHTGIAVARADLPVAAVPETADFPDAAYFEFGWGNAEFYPEPNPGIGLTLKAAFPGPAVVHVAGLPDHPAKTFPAAEWAAVTLSDEGLQRLIAFLNASFDRRGAWRLASNAPGLYRFSRFYPGTGTFHLFHTCNTWTAEALAAAGLPIEAAGVQRASQVMDQVGNRKPAGN